jgi:hypothetical protein
MTTLSIPEKEVRPKRRFGAPKIKNVYTPDFDFLEMSHTNFFSYIRITAYQPSILTEQKYRFHCFRNVQKVQRNEVYII